MSGGTIVCSSPGNYLKGGTPRVIRKEISNGFMRVDTVVQTLEMLVDF